MKWYAYCHNKTLEDNNGGSLVLWHHLHALEELGHENGGMLDLTDPVPEDADVVMFQGEWWESIEYRLKKSNAKRICWLGHFFPASRYAMPDIRRIEADVFHTQYEGEAPDKARELLKKEIHYLPHAGCLKCNTPGKYNKELRHERVIVRNKFNERSEEWLEYANVDRVEVPFEKVKDVYRSSTVCPNLHGDFQKGISCEFFQVPAFMINERLFQVILSCGFAVSDNNPIVKKFFTEDEVPYAETKEDYKRIIDSFVANPESRDRYINSALKRITSEHLYTHRWKKLLPKISHLF